MSAYEDGKRYARDYWACPCIVCLRSWFGRGDRDGRFFRQGFYDQAKLDYPLDCINRVTRCSICEVIGGCPQPERDP